MRASGPQRRARSHSIALDRRRARCRPPPRGTPSSPLNVWLATSPPRLGPRHLDMHLAPSTRGSVRHRAPPHLDRHLTTSTPGSPRHRAPPHLDRHLTTSTPGWPHRHTPPRRRVAARHVDSRRHFDARLATLTRASSHRLCTSPRPRHLDSGLAASTPAPPTCARTSPRRVAARHVESQLATSTPGSSLRRAPRDFDSRLATSTPASLARRPHRASPWHTFTRRARTLPSFLLTPTSRLARYLPSVNSLSVFPLNSRLCKNIPKRKVLKRMRCAQCTRCCRLPA
ncbi:hypothetical protein K438DRAFT_882369 [Mycena galopus ATCC 62051]|nr:hypothetical protein K438DRAFT_882369 [Mycena galopus ATCC 62051]